MSYAPDRPREAPNSVSDRQCVHDRLRESEEKGVAYALALGDAGDEEDDEWIIEESV